MPLHSIVEGSSVYEINANDRTVNLIASISHEINISDRKEGDAFADMQRIAVCAEDLQDFLSTLHDESSYYISTKPETAGCVEAARQRFNPETKSLGVNPQQEVKSMLMVDDKGQYHYFLMAGDKILSKKITRRKLNPVVLEEKDLLIPYTLNPSTVMHYFRDNHIPQENISIIIDPDLAETKHPYLTNNFGSRLLSITMNSRTYLEYVKSSAEKHGFKVKTGDKSFFAKDPLIPSLEPSHLSPLHKLKLSQKSLGL